MSFPGATKNTRDQLKEAGGTPLPIGSISDGYLVRRNGQSLEGIAAPWISGTGATVRLTNGYLEIKNADTGLWHQVTISGAEGFETLGFTTPGTV